MDGEPGLAGKLPVQGGIAGRVAAIALWRLGKIKFLQFFVASAKFEKHLSYEQTFTELGLSSDAVNRFRAGKLVFRG